MRERKGVIRRFFFYFLLTPFWMWFLNQLLSRVEKLSLNNAVGNELLIIYPEEKGMPSLYSSFQEQKDDVSEGFDRMEALWAEQMARFEERLDRLQSELAEIKAGGSKAHRRRSSTSKSPEPIEQAPANRTPVLAQHMRKFIKSREHQL